MRKILIIAAIFLMVAGAYAQECPADKVCVSREVALKAIADADKVTALEAEGKAKDQAISDLKDLLNKSKVEFASVSGENTALRQNDVSNRAIITVLLQSTKKQCKPFSICVF